MKKRKKIDAYIGGENDSWNDMLPEDFSQFFSKEKILIVFVILVVMLLLAGIRI